MKLGISASALVATAAIGLGSAIAACGSSSPAQVRPAPTVTITRPPAGTTPAAPAAPPGTAPAGTAPAGGGNVTDPWAVVSAYYGDIESGHYGQAWRLVGSGSTTGQSYRQFVDGFSCTGSQTLTEVSESGDTVTFDLAAQDACSGQVQHYTGTDTVQNGIITAASVHLSS
jgi:hypothetical protein